MAKVVLSLSGGMDSGTLLFHHLKRGDAVHAVSAHYGSKHNPMELACASQLVEHARSQGYNVSYSVLPLGAAMLGLKSTLMSGQGEIPEGHYTAESMKSTVVPGRNLIFISLLAAIAESLEYGVVSLGVHSGDHAIYPDCRPEFIKAANAVVQASSAGKVSVQAPFLDYDKTSILALGLANGTPYQFTRTCYKEQDLSCGKCGSCTERLEAFRNLNTPDPIGYETNE